MKKQLIAMAILMTIATSINAMQGQTSITYNDQYKFDVYRYLTAKDLSGLKPGRSFTLNNVDKFAIPGSPQELRDANGNVWAKKTGAFFSGTSNRGYETWNVVATPATVKTAAVKTAVQPPAPKTPPSIPARSDLTEQAKRVPAPATEPREIPTAKPVTPIKPAPAVIKAAQPAAPKRVLQETEITFTPGSAPLIAKREIVPAVQPQIATQETPRPATELRAKKLKPVEITMVPTPLIAKREIVPAVQPQQAIISSPDRELQAIKETVPAQVFETEETTLQLEPKLAQPAQESPLKGLAQKLAAGMKSTFQQTPDFQSLYYNAISKGDIKELTNLLGKGANPNIVIDITRNKSKKPLEVAFDSDIPENTKIIIMNNLIIAGADKKTLNLFLLKSVKNGNVELVKWLLSQGATEYLNRAIVNANEMILNNPEDKKFQTIEDILLGEKAR